MKKRKAKPLSATKLNNDKPFWDLDLNPITMQPVIHFYWRNLIGLPNFHINKNNNRLVKEL